MNVSAKLRLFLWRHPEWWTVVLCVGAWAVMLLESWRDTGHGAHHRMKFAPDVLSWILMVAAMMLPLVRTSVQTVAANSLWSRRHRAVAGFLAGFLGSWLAAGLVAAALREASWTHSNLVAALVFGAAAWWQTTVLHWRAVTACHRVEPLAAFGWRAHRDCLRTGAVVGAACVSSCWPLMLACAFTGHSPVAMAGGMAVGFAERRYRPRARAMLAMTLALAFYYGALAALKPNTAAAAPQAQPAAPAPEIVGSTASPFALGRGETRVELALHPPANPLFLHAGPQRRVFLNVERIVSGKGSGPWFVYLNLPPNETASPAPKRFAGDLPMFGLAEASRSGGKQKPEGLTEHLDITDLYARLPSLPGWDPKRLAVTFVPRYAGDVRIRIDRVTVSMARR